ncbi:hypothetical protein EN836_25665 [Mesorhizobium sp. M1C.F.Ca.ET.193.01.1.1]|uniref:hypothetical protein n=1 Tax=unclassified Mesorhizobium TaxID=325217 RepID=UPI000FD1997A|nr:MULTISPECIES: hypothetical protein [unclassified Mesorhizobium]TGS94542.1 hypothetical protein EN820_45915 [bacterium M00.F.Ca.ET.177.01.1.1]TGQ51244.1 hypothetical protein EN853_25655 [Mesorhizobium sp. M1C.F.Ca.ET.210.01.1.1]TGQ67032.1 hypothetical protein EN855_025665 [Mesorhizobium sp. M1C.F.Ca.ET.212.01.1.1]TGR01155.1 hypothetical protein EN847_25655 [Mesorhizobium sp. M1C.F.Ca.ET.204.01.1.1]TGR21834.1 hypothetical protein EN839_25655 [Mesorhizobium sp. M1C.F.Ca.ET.196.01.1.1]
MLSISRYVLVAAMAVSALAGCKTATTRDCDNLKPNVTYHCKCCGTGAPCHQGKGGGNPGHSPDPTPQ